MSVDQKDLALLIRDKYAGDTGADMREDIERLAFGEPLAYVIGWVPFLNLSLRLDSHPLIPRPETEWWTEALIEHLTERFEDQPFSLLDLCAGSGAIGLSVLSSRTHSRVSFAEISPLHSALIALNADENNVDKNRMEVRSGDLFAPYPSEKFAVIATNPPYVPKGRILDESVSTFEPSEALYSGEEGLDLIRSIIEETPTHLLPDGELWMECDISNIQEAAALMKSRGFTNVEIRNDLYGRPRIVVGYFL